MKRAPSPRRSPSLHDLPTHILLAMAYASTERGVTISHALTVAHRFGFAAASQLARFRAGRSEADIELADGRSVETHDGRDENLLARNAQQALMDLELYVYCVQQVASHLQAISRAADDRSIVDACARSLAELELLGGAEQPRERGSASDPIGDLYHFGQLSGEIYRLGASAWNVSIPSASGIENAVDDVDRAIRVALIERLTAAPGPGKAAKIQKEATAHDDP